jgi:hypothetical protein
MLVVVLDTNILVADFRWASAPFRLGRRETARSAPSRSARLVLRETANKYAERVVRAIADVRRRGGGRPICARGDDDQPLMDRVARNRDLSTGLMGESTRA